MLKNYYFTVVILYCVYYKNNNLPRVRFYVGGLDRVFFINQIEFVATGKLSPFPKRKHGHVTRVLNTFLSTLTTLDKNKESFYIFRNVTILLSLFFVPHKQTYNLKNIPLESVYRPDTFQLS